MSARLPPEEHDETRISTVCFVTELGSRTAPPTLGGVLRLLTELGEVDQRLSRLRHELRGPPERRFQAPCHDAAVLVAVLAG